MKNLKILFATIFLVSLAVSCEYTYDGNNVAPQSNDLATLVNVASWNSGNAAFECLQAGGCGAFSWKVDAAAPDGYYNTNSNEYGNTPSGVNAVITISNSTGKSFDWSINSGFEVCKVIVKASNSAVIYSYEGATSDAGLLSPMNTKNGNPYEISHVTFCFRQVEGHCYQPQTAWSSGARYVAKGNWATYTAYSAGTTANIYAGQSMLAGTVTFSAVVDGMVTLDINLSNNFVFYYNLVATENLKVEGYNSTPLAKNPAPGLFTHKYIVPVGDTHKEITIPAKSFYGIHIDVAKVVECP